MKKRITSVLCLASMIAMLFSACASTGNSTSSNTTAAPTVQTTAQNTTEAVKRDVITIDYMANASVAGLASGKWWTKKLEEDLGVKLNIISFTQDAYNTALAANDLPDLVFLTSSELFVPNALAGGQLINFDDFAKFMPNVYKNIPEGALRFQRDKYGDGKKLYTIPDGATNEYQTAGGIEYGFRLKWDYYTEYIEKNGEPVLKDLEDFLPLFKGIQDAHPKNENGQNTYSLSLFSGWDGACYLQFDCAMSEILGYSYPLYPLEINQNDLSYKLIWDDNSQFKRTMDFLFKANQMGLVDPDAITQPLEDYSAKIMDGRTLSYFAWGGNAASVGFRLLPFENMKTNNYGGPWSLGNVSGSASCWASSNSDQNTQERVCELINYLMDYDNVWYMYNGPKGEFWDLNSEGIPYVTETGAKMEASTDTKFTDGGNPIFESFGGAIGYWRALNPRNVHPKYGVTFSSDTWALRDGFKKDDFQISWENYMVKKFNPTFKGKLTDTQLINASNSFATARICSPTTPDKIRDFHSRMSGVYGNFWKMIYAKNTKEYESLWKMTQKSLQEMFDTTGYTADSLFAIYNDQLKKNEAYIK